MVKRQVYVSNSTIQQAAVVIQRFGTHKCVPYEWPVHYQKQNISVYSPSFPSVLKKGSEFSLFTLNHVIWLGLCGLGIFLGLYLAEKKRLSLKTAALVVSVISVLSESCKMMTHMLPSPLGGLALVLMTLLHLPFILAERKKAAAASK